MMISRVVTAASLLMVSVGVFAGTAAVPAPVLGAFGPAGLAVAGVGYVAYKLYQRRK